MARASPAGNPSGIPSMVAFLEGKKRKEGKRGRVKGAVSGDLWCILHLKRSPGLRMEKGGGKKKGKGKRWKVAYW